MKPRALGKAFGATACGAVVLLLAMFVYTDNVLDGRLDRHVLAAKMWGVPEALQRHGFEPFYTGPRETGWDGQFYFYIANDPLALTDAPSKLDADAYRYQRIGLPVVAWLTSRVLAADWVSPTVYFATNLGIVLLATLVGALHLLRRGRRPWTILLWTLSGGVVLTVINGLPDAAADAFLLMALVHHLERKPLGYVVFATLAALSREAYILFPVVIAAFDWWNHATTGAPGGAALRSMSWSATRRWLARRLWIAALPGVAFAGWQIYLRLRFHHAPSSQATAILGWPFASFAHYFMLCVESRHPLLPPGLPQLREGAALVCFLLFVVLGAFVPWVALRRAGATAPEAPIAAATLLLAALYACFGDTVMMHYTGHMKALGVFIVTGLLIWQPLSRRMRAGVVGFFVATDIFYAHYLWVDRIGIETGYDRYVRASQVVDTAPKPCLAAFDARFALVGIEDLQGGSLIHADLGPRAVVYDLAVTNATNTPFKSTTVAGSVNVSYHWLGADGRTVVRDGIRSYLVEDLLPGQTRSVPVVVVYPEKRGHYILRFTLVQEGCAWFYQVNPASKLDIDFNVR